MGASIRRLGGVVLAGALVAGLSSGTASAAPGRDDLRQAMTELAGSGAAGVQLRITTSRATGPARRVCAS